MSQPGADLSLVEREERLTAIGQGLAIALSPDQIQALLAYLDLLQRWNAVYNLTAVRDPAEMLTHHLADSLAILPALRRHAGGQPQRILDVGSGGGLPGVVIAIAEPAFAVTCIDTVAKKAGFIRQVAAELRLPNLRAEHGRVEAPSPDRADVIVSRAFASLVDFTRLSRHRLAPHGVWMAMKGRHPSAEISELPADVLVFHVEHLDVPGLAAERCLVWMRPSEPRSD